MFDFQNYIAQHKTTRSSKVVVQNYAYLDDMQRMRQLAGIPLLPIFFQKSLQAWNMTERVRLRRISKDVDIEPRSARIWKTVCADMGVECRETRIIPGQKAFCAPYGDGNEVFFGISPACCALPTTSMRFVFGSAIGAHSNGHVPYMTLVRFADKLSLGIIGKATSFADELLHWERASLITQDRAGLLASCDLSAAIFMIMKSVLDWSDNEIMVEIRRYYNGKDVDFGEREVESRVQALEIFAKSALYAQMRGLTDDGCISMSEVDDLVMRNVKVWL